MRYVRIGTLYEPGVHDLGVELLRYEVHMATWKRTTAERRQEALAFIRGSGLEAVIETFGLPLEAVNFRNAFTQCVAQKSLWSSATTVAISS